MQFWRANPHVDFVQRQFDEMDGMASKKRRKGSRHDGHTGTFIKSLSMLDALEQNIN